MPTSATRDYRRLRRGPWSQPALAGLGVKKILHAVAIDPFYDSSVELVRETLERALAMAARLGAKTVTMPALATGYGHLSMVQFGEAFAQATKADWSPIERLVVVVRIPEDAMTIKAAMAQLE